MRANRERLGPPVRKIARALGLLFALFLTTFAHAAEEKKRKLPDYDGRKDHGTKPGDVALWVPRVILSPLYLVSEYVIRRPLGALITAAERANLPSVIYDFFTFGPDHKAGVAPIFFVDFGFKPSVGIYLFGDDAFFKGNDLRIHGSIWTGDWLAGVLTDRVALGKDQSVAFTFTGIRRPDHVFYGLGPRTVQADESRYGEDVLDANVGFDVKLWRSSRVQTNSGVRATHFRPGRFEKDPSLDEAAARGAFVVPAGYEAGYTAQYNHALLALDSRRPRPAEGSGVRLEAEAEQGTDVRAAQGSTWIRYGATAGAFYDLNDHSRVVSLSLATLFADPVAQGPVPFTELVSLGGSGAMRGFWPGRLVDRSAAVLTARYRWPIWSFIDGAMEVALGNVFGEHLREFDASLLRLSGALGIGTVGSPDSSLELLVGFGTETFEHGGQVDSARIVLGTNRGF